MWYFSKYIPFKTKWKCRWVYFFFFSSYTRKSTHLPGETHLLTWLIPAHYIMLFLPSHHLCLKNHSNIPQQSAALLCSFPWNTSINDPPLTGFVSLLCDVRDVQEISNGTGGIYHPRSYVRCSSQNHRKQKEDLCLDFTIKRFEI